MKPGWIPLLLLASLSVQADVVMVSGTVYDVGKGSHSQDTDVTYVQDSNMCWAATSANVIQHWQDAFGAPDGVVDGYATPSHTLPSGTQYLQLFDSLTHHFPNAGNNITAALSWLYGNSSPITAQYIWHSSLTTRADLKAALDVPFSRKGQAVYLGLEGSVSHAITCWGYETDEHGTLVALYISDSDDLQYGARRVLVTELASGGLGIESPYVNGSYSDADVKTYRIDDIAYLKGGPVETKPSNALTSLPPDGIISGTADMSGRSLRSSKGITIAPDSILAASGSVGSLALGTTSGTVSGTGMTASAGSLVSLHNVSVGVSGFTGNGIVAHCELYMCNGSVSVSQNKGTGITIGGSLTDPRSYLEMCGNDELVLTDNQKGGLRVVCGAIPNKASSTSYYPSSAQATVDKNKSVVIRGNAAEIGGGVAVSGDMFLNDNTSVEFKQNKAAAKGGALAVFSEKSARPVCSGDVEISDNTSLVFSGNEAGEMGGAIYVGGTMWFVHNTDVEISGNKAAKGSALCVSTELTPSDQGGYYTQYAEMDMNDNTSLRITGNISSGSDVIFHQGKRLSMNHNGAILISGNDANAGSSAADGYVIHVADSKIILDNGYYMPLSGGVTLEIAHNDSFVFENNKAELDIYNENKVYLCADAGQGITFQHGIRNASGSGVSTIIGEDRLGATGGGSYVFADGSAQVEMTAAKGEIKADGQMVFSPQTGLNVSKTSLKDATFTLGSASLTLEDVSLSLSLTVDFGHYSETNSLTMTNVSVGSGTALSMSIHLESPADSASTLATTTNTRLLLRDYLGSADGLDKFSSVSLEVTGKLDRGVGLVIDTTGFDYVDGLTVEGYTLNKTVGKLLYYDRKLAEPITWNNATGSGLWNDDAENWQSGGLTHAYIEDAEVHFTDAGAGVVRLNGLLAPDGVVVENSAGADYSFVGSGSLSGGTTLAKRGAGALTIATANSYTGDTTIEAGSLAVGNAAALGQGNVSLKGGTLDLGGYAVGNNVTATGGTLSHASGYKGNLTVHGTVSLEGTTKARSLVVNGGRLSGGSIKNTPITITGGAVASVIEGSSSVSTSGNATLVQANSYTGATTINGGTLTLGHESALGGSAVSLKAGTLDLAHTAATNTITLAGGSTGTIAHGSAFAGTVLLKGGNLTLSQNLGGELVLDGGVLKLASSGALQLGTVSTTAQTQLDISSFSLPGVGAYAIFSFADGSVINTSLLTPVTSSDFVGLGVTLQLQENELVLNISEFVSGKSLEFTGGDKLLNVVASPRNISVSGSEDTSIAGTGSITGATRLEKTGSSTLTMGTTNSFTGGTVIQEGTVAVAADGALGNGSVTLNKGKLAINGYDLSRNSLKFKDTAEVRGGTEGQLASLDMATPGILDRDGALLFGGEMTLDGSLKVANLHAGMGNIKGGSVEVTQTITAEAGTISANLSGAASFTKQSRGIVTLKGRNSWTGTTTLNGGKLVIAGQSSLTSLTINGGTLAITASGSLSLNGLFTLANAASMDFTGNATTITLGSIDSLLEDFLTDNGYSLTENDDSLILAEALPVHAAADNGPVAMAAEGPVPAVAAAPTAPAAAVSSLAQGAWGAARAARLFTQSVADHEGAGSAALDASGTRSAWFSTMGAFARTESHGMAGGADADILGGALGMQFNGSNGGNIGLAIGQTWGRISPTDGGASVTQKAQHAALYGSKTLVNREHDRVGVSATAAYSTTDSDTTQNGHGFDWTQQGAVLGLRGTWEHAVSGATAVYGFLGTEYLATNSGRTENGQSGSVLDWKVELGAGARHTAGKLTVYADAAFAPSLVRHNPVAESDGTRGGASNPGRLEIHANAGAAYQLNDHWNLHAGYSYEGAARENSHNVRAGATYTF